MVDRKEPKWSKKDLDRILQDEHVLTTVVELLPFYELLELAILDPQLGRGPVDPRNGQLKLFWQLFLRTHWEQFILANGLARFKRAYNWYDGTVQAIVQALRESLQRDDEKHGGPRAFPSFYIPPNFYFGDEELLFVYAMLGLYFEYYECKQFDLYGRGLHLFGLDVPFAQIAFDVDDNRVPFFHTRTKDMELQTSLGTVESRYAMAQVRRLVSMRKSPSYRTGVFHETLRVVCIWTIDSQAARLHFATLTILLQLSSTANGKI
jgi:hypothetical protein